jgi:hypothetical protein
MISVGTRVEYQVWRFLPLSEKTEMETVQAVVHYADENQIVVMTPERQMLALPRRQGRFRVCE